CLIDVLTVLVAERLRQGHDREPIEDVIPPGQFGRHSLRGRANRSGRRRGGRTGSGGGIGVGIGALRRQRRLVVGRHDHRRTGFRRRRDRPCFRTRWILLIVTTIDLTAIRRKAWIG